MAKRTFLDLDLNSCKRGVSKSTIFKTNFKINKLIEKYESEVEKCEKLISKDSKLNQIVRNEYFLKMIRCEIFINDLKTLLIGEK